MSVFIFTSLVMKAFCLDHTSQVQQPLLVAPQQLPRPKEAVGGSQEDERHRLGRKNPAAGEKPATIAATLLLISVYSQRRQCFLSFSPKFQVYEDVSQCCQALSQRLGTQPFFFNKQYVSVFSV